MELRFIQPGKPVQNAYIESFNSRLRDECLSQHWFASLSQLIGAAGVAAMVRGFALRLAFDRQQIDADGHQEHNYPDYDLNRLPLSRVQDRNGLPLSCSNAAAAGVGWRLTVATNSNRPAMALALGAMPRAILRILT